MKRRLRARAPLSPWALLALAVASALIAFTLLRAVEPGSGGSSDPEAGLSDSERQALHATALARSATQLRASRLEFAASGMSLDELPQYGIQSIAAAGTLDLGVSMRESEAVLVVQSLGAYVDTSDGTLRLKLRVIETIKGFSEPAIEVAMTGGPERLPDGTWVLGVAPYEVFLPTGQTAILPLERVSGSRFVQRAFEAMPIENGHIAPRPPFAFSTALGGVNVDEARNRLLQAAQ